MMPGQSYNGPIPGMGLPPEYSQQLFTNLQAQSLGQRRAQNQAAIDNTSGNPMMSGVSAMMQNQNAQNQGNEALNQGRDAQLQGAQAAMQDRRIQQQRDFEGQQNAANRQVQMSGQQNMANMQQVNMNNQNQQGLLGLGAGAVGMLAGGPIGAGIGQAMAGKMFGPSFMQNYYGGGGQQPVY